MSNVTFELEFDHAVQKIINGSESVITSGNIYVGSTGYYALTYGADIYYRINNQDIFAYNWKNVLLNGITYSGIEYIDPETTISINNAYTIAGVIVPSENRYITLSGVVGSTTKGYSANGNIYDSNNTLHRYFDDNNAICKEKWDDPSTRPQYLVINLHYYGRYEAIFHEIQNSSCSVICSPLELNITNVYPINVNCRNDRTINVTWEYIDPRNSTYYYPVSATVTVTQGQTVKTYTTTESDITCPIPTNELTPGEATYKVTLTSNYGGSYDSPEQTFTVIGQTSAPEITNITQDSFPTITWNCADQAAWELLIRDSNSVVYHSDMKAGTEQSYTLPVMLEDGSYSVEMRALNIYGYYTDWGSYGLTLSPTKPDAATNLIVSTNANYTVTIDCTAPEDAGTLYVVRRRTPNDKAEIIGEYNNGFTDYYVPVNTTYEYAVRNYVTGYADTDFIDATIKCPGVVIRDGEDLSRFIPLWKNDNEEFDVITNDSRSDTLVQCLGRKYPVNEVGEWITSTRTFTAHVSASDINKLNDINLNSKCVYLQNKDECIPCKMEITDAGEYNGGGRIINFTLTRIDEEMA